MFSYNCKKLVYILSYMNLTESFLGRFKSDFFDVIAKGVIYANSRFVI